jgi:protein TonB
VPQRPTDTATPSPASQTRQEASPPPDPLSGLSLPPPAEPTAAPVAEASSPAPEPETAPPPIPLPPTAVRPIADPGNRPPEYPAGVEDQSRDALVYLKVVLSAAGRVEDVQVLAGDPAFTEAAVSAAQGWSYSPALVDGRPTAVYFVVKVPFRGRER